MTKRIVLVGASGLIGNQVVNLLPGVEFDVHILARRNLVGSPSGVSPHIADPAQWPERIARLTPDVAISCLGSTWNKSGRSEAAFRAIDVELVLAFAAAAQKAGACHMISVSAVGASAKSTGFYLRIKGEMEDGLKQLRFERLDILRPGLLTGERGGERRLGERVGIMLSPVTDALLHGSLRRYRSIDSGTVARAIVNVTNSVGQGTFIHENDSISALGG